MATIIVIGGEGFVGSNLIEKLYKSTNHDIVSIDCNLTGVKRPKILSSRVQYYSSTLVGPGRTEVVLASVISRAAEVGNKVETIFHFGEFSRVVQSLPQIDKVIESNVRLTSFVIQKCKEHGIRLIYSASSTRFNIAGEVDHEMINKLPYPFFKSQMVDTIERYGEWFNLNYNIAYFYNVYGPSQVDTGSYATVIGIWERQAREGHPLSVIGDGSQTRDFTHISDIIDGLWIIYRSGKAKEDYHLGTGKEIKIIDAAKALSDNISFLPEIPSERKRGRAPFGNHKIRSLGWSPKKDLMEYLKAVKASLTKS